MKLIPTRQRFTFFQRQFLSLLFLSLFVLVLVSFIFVYLFKLHIYDEKTEELESAGDTISRLLLREEVPDLTLSAYRTMLRERNISFVAMNAKGQLYFKDQRNAPPTFRSKTFMESLLAQIPKLESGKALIVEESGPDPYLVYPHEFKIKNQDGNNYLFVMSPVKGITQTISRVYETVMLAGLLVLVLAMAIALIVSRNMSRGVQSIRRATRLIADGHYDARSDLKRTDELGDLARDFNRMAEQLEAASRKLESNEVKRQRFITDVTHELRTPLTSIRGIVEGLRSDYITGQEQQAKYYGIIEDETLRLIRLINELLDMEKIQHGLITLRKEEYPLHDLLEVLAESFGFLIDDKPIRLEIDCQPDTVIYGDYDRLTQILINLIKNSIQFTSYGTIRLTGTMTASATELSITDTGRGMSTEEMEQIWDRFYKADPSRSKDRSETGLGLSIVKRLVEAHEAQIHVTSSPGSGTTFLLRFPLQEASASQEVNRRPE
ncbi:sensor histidine kinase [Paenibacillus lutrae]|uniref:histidine kinase n=1 Tax=Paenibacillus lutrae TaxID=2078573 RepID=A0A7X3FLR6_9BACL|nr:HAMP domain-containing sensor histidine kinase [Paenibacillus lutrae]MVP01804.1 HAMP domain-containing protein [Paenibacillus lutrae]